METNLEKKMVAESGPIPMAKMQRHNLNMGSITKKRDAGTSPL